MSDRGPFLQNAASHGAVQSIVNTEPEKHMAEVPKRELPSTIGDSLFGHAKNISGTLGIQTSSYRALVLWGAIEMKVCRETRNLKSC